jgi:glutamine amidotransferase
LFESSDESPNVDGLCLLKGQIKRIPDKEGLKIPHMGWNSLTIKPDSPLFKGIPNDSYVYFVHSYYLDARDKSIVAATTNYSVDIDASVHSGNIYACQFHPEKSGTVGLNILKNFLELEG